MQIEENGDCRKAVENKNELHKKMLQRETKGTRDAYKAAWREATKTCKKKEWMEERVRKIEGEQVKENIWEMYKSVRELSTGYMPILNI